MAAVPPALCLRQRVASGGVCGVKWFTAQGTRHMGKRRMNYFRMNLKTLSLVAVIMCISCGNYSRKMDTSDKTAGRTTEETAPMHHMENDKHINNPSKQYTMRWFAGEALHETKGVALVIHGLNLRPDKMGSIIARLTDAGVEALNLSLRGHGENFSHADIRDSHKARLESFKSVSYQLWLQETRAAYQVAKKRSAQLEVPLFLVGFSLGGLMGTDLLVADPGVQFDRMVLFAPALKLHWKSNLIRVLSPFPGLTIPSFTAASYQTNDGTPMAGYNALFESLKSVEANLGPKANIPTLVFIDKKDEMVSFSRLKNMVVEQKLDRWQFYIVQKESSKGPAKIHHLIIDEASTGEDVWREMMEAMVIHLYD